MVTTRLLLFVTVVLTFVSGVPGLRPLTEGDIDGELGPGRTFSSSSVEFKGSVENMEDITSCCKACQSKYSDIQLVDFHIQYLYCQCSAVKNVRPATDLYSTYVAGIC